jgi:hypothetical protein
MAAERDAKGRWPSGVSGNPAGVSSDRHEAKRRVREILEAAAPDAAVKLQDLINDPDPKIAFRVSCYVVDQVIGKAQGAEDESGADKPQRVELFINGQEVRRIAVPEDEQEEMTQ